MKSILSEEIKDMFLLMGRMENGKKMSKSNLFEIGGFNFTSNNVTKQTNTGAGKKTFNCHMSKTTDPDTGAAIVHFTFLNIPMNLMKKAWVYGTNYASTYDGANEPNMIKSMNGNFYNMEISCPLTIEGEDSEFDTGFGNFLSAYNDDDDFSENTVTNADDIVNNLFVPLASDLCELVKGQVDVSPVLKQTIDRPDNSDGKGLYKDDLIDLIERTPDEFDNEEENAQKNPLNLSFNELAEALKDGFSKGTWPGFFTKMFPTIDIKSRIYGKLLSIRNQLRVKNKYLKYSKKNATSKKPLIEPTIVYSRSTWEDKFHCMPIKHPRMAYPLEVPNAGRANNDDIERNEREMNLDQGSSTQWGGTAHAATARKKFSRGMTFKNAYGYDISDVRPFDQEGVEHLKSLYNQAGHSIPGITNNFSGGINHAAEENDASYIEKAKEAAVENDAKQILNDVSDIEAKATLFNCALKGFKINDVDQLKDVVEGSGEESVSTFLHNVKEQAENWCTSKLGHSNPKIYGTWIDVITYAVAGFTIGQDYLQEPSNVQFITEDADYGQMLTAISGIYTKISRGIDTLIVNTKATDKYGKEDIDQNYYDDETEIAESIKKNFFRFI